MNKLKSYYRLIKPGIVYGNALVAAAAFLFASGPSIDWQLFGATVIGLAGVIASACVFNNYYDREIDAKMERTKSRALASGSISPGVALALALFLGGGGAMLLQNFSSPLALTFALSGFLIYVAWYTPLKHRSPLALFVGALAGAMPPVVGYTAVTNAFDMYALALFLFLYIWQIAHFLAISIYRFEEYAAAGVPLYIKKSPSERARRIAKKAFLYSLVVLLLFCLALIVQRW